MLNLKAYCDELFRVDEVLSAKFDEWLKFDERYFYKQNEFNTSFLAAHFDLDKNLSNNEVKSLLITPLKNHFLEGTFYSLQKALSAFYSTAKISEWHSYGGKPYHFKLKIDLDINAIDTQNTQNIEKVVNSLKNVRSVLESIVFDKKAKNKIYFGANTTSKESINAYYFTPDAINTPLTHKLKYGACNFIREQININKG